MATVTHGITVKAPFEFTFRIAKDVRRWRDFMAVLKELRVLREGPYSTTVELREDVGAEGMETIYNVRPLPEGTIVSHQLRGRLSHMRVEWRLRPVGRETMVTVIHDFRCGWPVIGEWVDRYFIIPRCIGRIAPLTLDNFRTLVEKEYDLYRKFDPYPRIHR